MKKLTLIVAVILCATSFARAQDNPLLMRTPTVNKTHIVFSYAGDLWAVGRDGGEASRLTTASGSLSRVNTTATLMFMSCRRQEACRNV
jgi:tricorn protease